MDADPEISSLLTHLSLDTLRDLCLAYELDVEPARHAMQSALLRSSATAGEVLDLLDEAERGRLYEALGVADEAAVLTELTRLLPRPGLPRRRPLSPRPRWERLDTRVAQAFLVLALLSPLFGPVYGVLFASQIEPRLEALRLEAAVTLSRRAHQLDPWGREFVTGMDLCYSVGPNGVDENGGGDDVWVMEGSIYRVVERPAVAIYLGAPWNVLTLLALLWATFALARLLPRGRALLEALATLAAAAPLLILATWLVDSYGWFVDGVLTDVLVIPAWLAAWLTCALLTLLGVTGLRRWRS